MNPRRFRALLIVLMGALAIVAAGVAPASAHPGHARAAGEHAGFAQGLVHPLTGIDHLLAVFVVGLIATRCGGAWRHLPAVFCAAMAIGFAAGQQLVLSPAVANGAMTASLIFAGFAILVGARTTGQRATMLVIALALLHGLVHAADRGALSTAYAAGLFASTFALQSLTFGVAVMSRDRFRGVTIRLAGAAVAVASLVAVVVRN